MLTACSRSDGSALLCTLVAFCLANNEQMCMEANAELLAYVSHSERSDSLLSE